MYKNLIDSRFHSYLKDDVKNKIYYLDTNDIDFSKRVDIIVKINFLKAIINNDAEKITYYEKLYIDTISAFTDNSFIEPGESFKRSQQDYLKSFREIYINILENGFDETKGLVPVSPSGVPLDGAHRIAIANVLNIKIPVIELKNLECNYDINYFDKKTKDDSLIFNLVTELAHFDKAIRIAIVWPFAKQKDTSYLEELLNEDFIFSRSLDLSLNGINNICLACYEKEKWIGNYKNKWDGSWGKSKKVYSDQEKTHVVLFKTHGIDNDILIKEKFRQQFSGLKHCIHMTDNQEETLGLVRCTFNQNSELILNNIQTTALKEIIYFLDKNKLYSENFVFTGSVILGLLGIRSFNDVDYIVAIGSTKSIVDKKLLSNSHNHYVKNYNHKISDYFIFNSLTFSFLGVNFIELNELYNFKKNRNESKDKDDIKLIENFISGTYGIRFIFLQKKRYIIMKYKHMVGLMYKKIIVITKLLGVYNILKKVKRNESH
ncbi:hypothetical protein [Superficieibacter sp. HKU1]|uniref:hypothetical protein n=1 Tax=Superficieibacter sp. HKU1 TaxID=3031919 RepID=UPI0023E140A1|nr:hypothetical protein [Superficieibacter sp. HKU1]WES66721.1 hypothetical protein P0H77_13795 [Superficieibacter sp. HKU1]